ncbi:MAG: hypothetical protein ACLSAP_01370 [Oscillospiraceae bacterium]
MKRMPGNAADFHAKMCCMEGRFHKNASQYAYTFCEKGTDQMFLNVFWLKLFYRKRRELVGKLEIELEMIWAGDILLDYHLTYLLTYK